MCMPCSLSALWIEHIPLTHSVTNAVQSIALIAGAKLEDQIKVMAELMMRRHLLIKADRRFKKPKPGMKRRAKWPKKLIPVPDQVITLSGA